jgi:hypothetical protein
MKPSDMKKEITMTDKTANEIYRKFKTLFRRK